MQSARDIRQRIKSISSTAQITKAMQMVAASKMRKIQQAALAGRPFCAADVPYPARSDLSPGRVRHPLLEVREVRKRAVILIAADKGLCGPLNTNLFRLAAQFDPRSTVFITAGVRPPSSSPALAGSWSPSSLRDMPRFQRPGRLPPLPAISS